MKFNIPVVVIMKILLSIMYLNKQMVYFIVIIPISIVCLRICIRFNRLVGLLAAAVVGCLLHVDGSSVDGLLLLGDVLMMSLLAAPSCPHAHLHSVMAYCEQHKPLLTAISRSLECIYNLYLFYWNLIIKRNM